MTHAAYIRAKLQSRPGWLVGRSRNRSELDLQITSERIGVAVRQILRLLPAIGTNVAGTLLLWMSLGKPELGAVWLAASLLHTAFLFLAARQFDGDVGDQPRAACEDFYRKNCLAGILQGALTALVAFHAFPMLSYPAQIVATVLWLGTTGWLASTGAYLRSGFLLAVVVQSLAIICLWWTAGDPHALGGIILCVVVVASLVWLQREVEIQLHRQILLGIRNAFLVGESIKRNRLIETINKKKTEIIAAASHDLRQPVHALGLIVQRLNTRLSDAELQSMHSLVRGRVAVVSEMLSGLLDLSKLDSSQYKVKLDRVRLGELVAEVMDIYREAAQTKSIELKHDVPDVDLTTDPSLFKQILSNLMSNAIKYTNGGVVEIRGMNVRKRGLVLEVVDSGQGIPQASLDEIFIEYYRLPGHRNGAEEGLGIGLSLVKKAVALLDYKLNVSSTLGKGSRFKIGIPIKHIGPHISRHVQANDTRPGERDDNSAYRIFVLENDEIARDAMRRLTQDWGYQVQAFQSGECLLGYIKEHPNSRPDLMISDVHLGGSIDGLGYMDVARKELGTPDIPCLLLTGDLSLEMQQRASHGRYRVLYKPFQARLLRGEIRDALRSHAALV